METKKIYIVFVMIVVAFIGFLGYRHFKKSDEMKAHHEDTHQRLTERAQKSPRIGMSDMGRALKRYYAANNHYPQSLDVLYPDYIGARSFITDVNWDYRPSGSDFHLSKSVERGGKTLTAYMDSSLRTQLDADTMVAGTGTGKRIAVGGLELPSGIELLTALRAPDFELEEVKTTEEIGLFREEPRTVAIDEDATLSNFAASLSQSYLVWRDAKGHIGFGNVQYPHTERISIAAENRWLRVERRPVAGSNPEPSDAPALESKTGIKPLSPGLEGQYLAWRDGHGTIGFGNVQYPKPGEIAYIYVDGSWQVFEQNKSL